MSVSFTTKMNDILRPLTDALRISQDATTEAANKSRQPHDFQTGDSVFLNTRHLLLGYATAAGDEVVGKENGARLSRALQQRLAGPHRPSRARGENALKPDISDCRSSLIDGVSPPDRWPNGTAEPDHEAVPESVRRLRADQFISRTGNVADFKRNQEDYSRQQSPPPPVHIAKSGQAEFEVDRIVSWRERDGTAEFEAEWAGYADDENTSEPLANITRFGGKALFQEFVDGVDDERLRQLKLLPKAYGGTGRGRRRQVGCQISVGPHGICLDC